MTLRGEGDPGAFVENAARRTACLMEIKFRIFIGRSDNAFPAFKRINLVYQIEFN